MPKLARTLLPVIVLFSMVAAANATTLGFDCITNNNAADCFTGETQLFVDVSSESAGTALFHFYNTGPTASSITDIYFDDGTLLGIASIADSGVGVAFSQGASPGDLPGGNALDPDFGTTAGFLADSDAPAQPNGVNPNEFVDITFNLINGMDLDDVLAALNNGDLRIGLHVQGFDGGGSDSFVNSNPVPEPGTLLLLAAGGIGLMARRRRKAQVI